MLVIAVLMFIVALCAAFLGVRAKQRWGVRANRVAVPTARSLHSDPVPYGGGLVIALICLCAYPPISLFVAGTLSWGYFIGALLVAAVSYLDDLRKIGFAPRLLVHAAAAILLIADLDTWHGITALGGLQLGWAGYVLTFIWVVWMINSYNFMDGIDGLAGLQAAIAAAGWAVLSYMLDMPALFLFAIVITASSLGFLFHNWPPARIFLGDVGSAFLGFTFAALPLLARHMAVRAWDLLPIAAVLLVWFFIFDSVVTRARRLLRGENVLAAHREHLFQRLVASGMSHRRVSTLYGLLAAILAASVLLSIRFREGIGWTMFAVVCVLTAVLLWTLHSRGVLFKHID